MESNSAWSLSLKQHIIFILFSLYAKCDPRVNYKAKKPCIYSMRLSTEMLARPLIATFFVLFNVFHSSMRDEKIVLKKHLSQQ